MNRNDPPACLDDYELLGELGRGLTSVVYKARQKNLDRNVALKVIRIDDLVDPKDADRFLRGAKAAAKLDHPALVRVYEVGRAGDYLFAAMTLVEGDSLADRLKKSGPLSSRDALALALSLASAVAHAHAQGVLHRNLDPGSVLFDKSGRARLTGFGMARLVLRGDTLTNANDSTMSGFMAPETVTGSNSTGAGTDIYGFGATLYAALTGRAPVMGKNASEIADSVIRGDIVPPSKLVRKIPRGLEQVCLRCLATDPAKRFADADAIRTALEQATTNANTASRDKREAETGPVRRLRLILGAIALGLTVVLLWIGFWGVNRFNRQPNGSADPAEVAAAPPQRAAAPFSADQARDFQQAWAAYLGVPVEMENSLGMRFRLIPPGEFDMGATPEEVTELQRSYSDRKPFEDWDRPILPAAMPQHHVRITRPFYFGTYEVTVAQFARFIRETGYVTDAERSDRGGGAIDVKTGLFTNGKQYSWKDAGFPQTDQHPVVNFSYNDATAFSDWLSKREGRTYRLPTEAEWEYAARAGTTTLHYSGADLASLKGLENLPDDSIRGVIPFQKTFSWMPWNDGYVFTAPVGSFPPNPFGLHDVLGNAGELTADWYDSTYYARSPTEDPQGPETGSVCIYRGGGCEMNAAKEWFNSIARIGFCTRSDSNIVNAMRLIVELPQADGADGQSNDSMTAREGSNESRASKPTAVQLFEGTNLTGWEVFGAPVWKAANGILTASPPPNEEMSFLMSKADYADYELNLEYKLPPEGDSGIFLRVRAVDGDAPVPDFVEVQLTTAALPGDQGLGAIWKKVAPQPPPTAPADVWNRVRIQAVGDHIAVTVNDIKCIDTDIHYPRAVGQIALQAFRSSVEFRNVELIDLGTPGNLTSSRGMLERSAVETALVEELKRAELAITAGSSPSQGEFAWAACAAECAAAFKGYGFELGKGSESLRQLLNGRPADARNPVLTGLELWEVAADAAGQKNVAEQLRNVESELDEDPWRTRVRAIRTNPGAAGILPLATEASKQGSTIDRIDMLSRILLARKQMDKPESLVYFRATQKLHSKEFWPNLGLGLALREDAGRLTGVVKLTQLESATKSLRDAKAIHPQAVVIDSLIASVEGEFGSPEEDRKLANWVLEQGGRVLIRRVGETFTWQEIPVSSIEGLIKEPFRVIGISLTNQPIRDEQLATLPKTPFLQEAYLDGTKVSDDGIRELLRMRPSINCLNLEGTAVTDGLIENLRGLKAVYLRHSAITDTAAEKLAGAAQGPYVLHKTLSSKNSPPVVSGYSTSGTALHIDWNSWVELPFSLDLRQPVTIESVITMSPDLQSGETMPVGIYGDGAMGRFSLGILRPRRSVTYMENLDRGGMNTSSANMEPDHPTHLAAIYDGNDISYYVDGKHIGVATSTNFARPARTRCGINFLNLSERWRLIGDIREVRFSSTVRYTKNFTPVNRHEPDEHTVGLYHLDEGEGDVAKDSSGKNNHGKIHWPEWIREGEPRNRPGTRDREVAEWVIKKGGIVRLRLPRDATPAWHLLRQLSELPTGPFHVNGVSLSNLPVSDKDVELFNGLQFLTELHLEGTEVTDIGVEGLQRNAPNLSRLNIEETRVGDEGLKAVSYVKDLFVRKTAITASAVELSLREHSGTQILHESTTKPEWNQSGQNALHFDGRTTCVELPVEYLTGTPITYEATVTLATQIAPANRVVFSLRQRDGDPDLILGFDSRESVISRMHAGSGTWADAPWGKLEPAATARIATTYDGKTMRTFVNGKLVGEVMQEFLIKGLKSSSVVLGREPCEPKSPWHFHGTIREARISSTCRYTTDYKPLDRFETDINTLGLYHLDEGEGDVAKDSSGHDHHGKIIGAKWVSEGQTHP